MLELILTILYPKDLCNDKSLALQRLLQKFAFLVGHIMSMTPEQLQAWRWEREIDERNRPLSDEELDAMFPEGYKVKTVNMSVVVFRIWIFFGHAAWLAGSEFTNQGSNPGLGSESSES